LVIETLTLPIAAVVAGFVSFSSPCCLPLLPGYLSYVSALPVADLERAESRRVTLRAALLFVGGFTTIFVAMGVGATVIGSLLLRNQDRLLRWAGVAVILLGLSSMGLLRLPWLQRERRFDMSRIPRGPASAFPLGMAFAAGWAPCIGPILATILTTASVAGSAAWGGLLLALYSLGLGIPFVLLALGFRRAQGSLSWLKRHGRHIEIAGGTMLVGVGILFVTGDWNDLFRPLQRWFAELGWPPI
jgi:cytochrome c-type biogenesis protein